MDLLAWLQALGRDADPLAAGFQARRLYLLVSVLMPVGIGLTVGFGLRAVERLLGVVPTQRGGH